MSSQKSSAPSPADQADLAGGMNRRVLCVHLRDDFSGAANVFSQCITEVKRAGCDVRVLVGSGGDSGFIRNRHTVETVPYALADGKWRLLLQFLAVQFWLFFRVTSLCRQWRPDLVYVNALLPAGAMLAAAWSGCRVITHAHEVGMSSNLIFGLLRRSALRFSSRVICVSSYTAAALRIPPAQARVVHNSLDALDWQRADAIAGTKQHPAQGPFTVMLACSLKWYKGLDSFIALAQSFQGQEHARFAFQLVVNCEASELDQFLRSTPIPASVTITRRPPSVFAHYSGAHLTLNLSHPEGWIETFGMTLLEGMACAVPAVAPQVGGCLELAAEGQGIWFINSRDIASLHRLVLRLSSDTGAWQDASRAAHRSAQAFRIERFRVTLLDALGLLPQRTEHRIEAS